MRYLTKRIDQKFDGFEYHPCSFYSVNGNTFVEQCEPKDAVFWSVYAHLKIGGLECLADFKSEKQCKEFIEFLESVLANYIGPEQIETAAAG